jgi:hypothetical protein
MVRFTSSNGVGTKRLMQSATIVYNALKPEQRLKELDPASTKAKRLRNCAEKARVMLVELLLMYSKPNDLVVDFCAGTFSLGLACAMAGRRCLGFEIDESCAKTAMERVVNYLTHKCTDVYGNLNAAMLASYGCGANGDLVHYVSGLPLDHPLHLLPLHNITVDTHETDELRKETLDQACQRYGVEVFRCNKLGVGGNQVGRGLKTTRAFKKGDLLCPFPGTISLLREDFETEDNPFTFRKDSSLSNVVLQPDKSNTPAFYINSPLGVTGARANIEFSENVTDVTTGDVNPPHRWLECVLLSDLEEGAVLYVDYGLEFWTKAELAKVSGDVNTPDAAPVGRQLTNTKKTKKRKRLSEIVPAKKSTKTKQSKPRQAGKKKKEEERKGTKNRQTT